MNSSSTARKNVSKISNEERDFLIEEFIALNNRPKFKYPGSRDDKPFVRGVTYWFLQDEKHQAIFIVVQRSLHGIENYVGNLKSY